MKSSVICEEAGVWTCTMWMCMYLVKRCMCGCVLSEEMCGCVLVKRCVLSVDVYLVKRCVPSEEQCSL